MQVITRFAPAPTGNLHIGGARTALFNFLYAKANHGQFLVRIDDTDPARSSSVYENEILNSLAWLNITWDNSGNEPRQSERTDLYLEAVSRLIAEGNAYKCYANAEDDLRIKNIMDMTERKLALRSIPEREKYTVRFKMPLDGTKKYEYYYLGYPLGYGPNTDYYRITFKDLDDFVLLRSDGSPTYMLASVVDDGLMGITHVIRGDEHLANTYRQIPLFYALGYSIPDFRHIPLINDENGNKLSKRTGATSIYEYQEMGVLPEAMTNYMLRLGWSNGDQEIISLEEAKKIFRLSTLGVSPARFNLDKLLSLNSYYLKHLPNEQIISYLNVPERIIPQIRICIDNLKEKGNTLKYIEDMSIHIFSTPLARQFDELPDISDAERNFLIKLAEFAQVDFNSSETIQKTITNLVMEHNLNKRNIFMYLRIALTGMKVSPGLFEVMLALDKDLCKLRLNDALGIIEQG